MQKKRYLTQDTWYEVRTAVNNREPLFRAQAGDSDLLPDVWRGAEALRLRASRISA
jgi:hypothetical protein